MFGFVRLALGAVLGICIAALAKKLWGRPGRKFYFLVVVITTLFITLSAFVPFENAFITFKSPEAAYKYVNPGTSEIKLVIDGQHSSFIVGSEGDSNILFIAPKTPGGWKVGLGSYTKLPVHKIIDNLVIDVYQYRNTNDCYISVYSAEGGPLELSDTYGSVFIPLENFIYELGESYITYFAAIPSMETQYRLSVNGVDISVF